MLRKADKKDTAQIFAIMEESFPEDERRPFEEQEKLFLNSLYSLYVWDDEVKAFIATWEFDDFIFIEHFAVDEKFRNSGLGSMVLKEFLKTADKMVCLEVEPPETQIAKRRIGFYRRNGFFLNEYNYFQPPISKGKKSIPLMIMTFGACVAEEKFYHVRDVLYDKVYKYDGEEGMRKMDSKKIRIGMINWDACLPENTYFGHYTLNTLGNDKYKDRLPYFAQKKGNGYDFSYRTQEEYDRELRYAIDAGVDFFAYCWYPDTLCERNFWKDLGSSLLWEHYPELNLGRKLYQTSELNKEIKMCAILFTGRAYAISDIDDLIFAMKQDYYEKIDGRPIVCTFGGFEEGFIDELKLHTKKHGIDPYIVFFNTSATIHEGINYDKADAISAYAACCQCENFDDVISCVEEKNYKRLGAGLKEMPHVSIGWNPMPRVEKPSPWVNYPDGPYSQLPTEEQLEKCFDKLFDFIEKNPEKIVDGYAMVYAWNEFEEGGYLCPTLCENGEADTKFLESFKRVRGKYKK